MNDFSQADIECFVAIAKATALRSHATRLKVGSVLVNADRVMSIGYNGTPSGWCNTCEDENNNTLPEVIHSECNSLFKFVQAGLSTKNTTMFITHSPCLECSKSIYLAGVSKVYYVEAYRSDAGVNFLKKMGIEIHQYSCWK